MRCPTNVLTLPGMDTQPATNLQILTRYQEPPSENSRKMLEFKTEVAFSGVRPEAFDDRVTCGVLLIALGCFEVVLGAQGGEPDADYPNCVMVHTATRQVFATSLELEEVRVVLRMAVKAYADRAGLSEISEAVTRALISEAVQVLNADPVKFNARGGVA